MAQQDNVKAARIARTTGRIQEAADKKVIWSEETPEVFESFIYWLYFDRLAEPKVYDEDDDGLTDGPITPIRLSETQLVQVWTFGDRRGVPGLQNASMKDLHRRYLDTEVFDHSIIDVVFENTPPHAPLKYYLTAVAASLVKESEVKLYKDVHSMEFWLQLTEELVRLADHKHTRGGQWRERAEQVAKISVDEYLFA